MFEMTKSLIWTAALSALALKGALGAMPVQLLVNLRGTECLYDTLNEG